MGAPWCRRGAVDLGRASFRVFRVFRGLTPVRFCVLQCLRCSRGRFPRMWIRPGRSQGVSLLHFNELPAPTERFR